MHIQEDKQIVTWSMIILFLALTIVYSLVYMKKSDFFTNATIVPDTSLGGTESLPIPMVSNESSLS
ncbi:MAG: hypothetical protein LBH96_04400 [Candidatus Peribacteria bacterium]|nr:hypothetical protein [Candidatus Peribacteria bacterium]